MYRLKMLGLALLALCSFGAMTAVTASAEEGFLLGAGLKFTVTGETPTLLDNAKKSVKCAKVEGKSSLENDKHATVDLDFTGCEALGFPLNSLGDSSGTILARVLALVCLVDSAKLLFGIALEVEKFLEMESVHLEGFGGVLIDMLGTIIGHVLTAANKKAKVFVVDFAGKNGNEGNVKECTDAAGAKKWTLTAETNHNGEKLLVTEKVTNGAVTFDKEVELMDT